MSGEWQDAIERAQALAPFLADGLARLPELAALLEAGDGEAALAWAKRAGDDASDVPVALRRERRALALALAIGDLAGALPLARVLAELSDFADRALDAAIADAIRNRVPDSEPAGFTALALGKHGAGELNYSSDIDPILLYDPALLPRRERDEPGEAAQRVARRVVETLTAMTPEGYVFRVDLRLRPASEVSPLAISFDGALTHYESSALAWERAAFIRARSSAGDVAAGERFLAAIRPFVWRRSLDFGAIEEIRRLTERIRADHVGPREPGPGFDVKRGRGGIREIEFFAQTHQLIHGGRNPSLRLRGTRPALDALADAGLIAASDATLLGESYDRLRTIEHRLQMVADRQTHRLPQDSAAIDSVAKLDGVADGAVLIEELRGITASVGRLYDGLLGGSDAPSAAAPSGSALAARIAALGLPEPDKMAARIEGWSDGRMRALRSPAARTAFEDLLPSLLGALANSADPERALARWESLVGGLPSAVNLFRLLEARPGLADLVLRILTLAPTLADELARRTGLLDPLIDSTALDLPGSVEALAARMCHDGDYEERLDQIREVVGELRFALGVQLVEAANDPLDIAAALCRVAEAALVCAVDAASREFALTHGRIAGSDLLVLGLGRLGGGALTHASDLDLIYLFSGETDGGESDGRRPLSPTHYFNRLAQRVTAALSVPTAAGALYEVDTRLRPQGNQGPLAVTIDSFARYQSESAWTWEHMALTRARVLAGPPEARAVLEQVIAEVLHRPRDPAKLREDVLAMRGEMAEHKTPRGPLDAKLARGALVDLEFLVHYLQLRERTAFDPHLGVAIETLAREGLVPDGLVAAHDLLTRLLVAARLLAPDMALPPEPAASLLSRTCGHDTPDALLRAFAQARQCVAQAWADAFGEQLEIDDD